MKKRYELILLTSALTIMILTGLCFLQTTPARADDKRDAQQLVEKAKFTFQNFMADSNMGVMRDMIKEAKGVFIMPQLLRGAYIFGISGGSGIFFAKEKGQQWNGPAFYTVGGASIGLQIGGESSEVVLLAMTDRGVTAFLANNFKLGGDVDVAVGPIGIGISAQTANLSGDIISFSRSRGLYGGVSLQGAVVASRTNLNSAFYKEKVEKPMDILIRPAMASNEAAQAFQAEIAKAAKK